MYKFVVKYALAGALSTVFSMLSFPFIYEEIFLKNHFNLAFAISVILNISISFSLQRIFVFKSKNKLIKELTKFITGAVFLTVVGYVVGYIFVHLMGFSSYKVNMTVVALSSVASFIWHKFITFGVKA